MSNTEINLDHIVDLCMEMKLIHPHTNYAEAYEEIKEAYHFLGPEEFLCRYTIGLAQMIQVGFSQEHGPYKGFGTQTMSGVKLLFKV